MSDACLCMEECLCPCDCHLEGEDQSEERVEMLDATNEGEDSAEDGGSASKSADNVGAVNRGRHLRMGAVNPDI